MAGDGKRFCADVEKGLRSHAKLQQGLGYLFSGLGTAALATGTITAATGFDSDASQVSGEERAVTIAAPLVGTLLLYGAVELFTASAASSTGAEGASLAMNSTDSVAAAHECNTIIGAWNDERGVAASAAAVRFQKEVDELNKKVDEIAAKANKAGGAPNPAAAQANGAAGSNGAGEGTGKQVAPPAAAE